MIRSMTGFASAKGALAPFSWGWELRAVNAKGLDLRLRVPDWIEGLEPALRAGLGKDIQRGSVTLSLRLAREDTGSSLALNHTALAGVLDALEAAETEAMARGITLAPSKASDLLALRGVLEPAADDPATAPLRAQLVAELAGLLQDFDKMREDEGRALERILRAQLDQIDTLTAAATEIVETRREEMADTLERNLSRVLTNADGTDPDRLAQELAMIAVKADVTEELDRLRAHIGAARDLLAGKGPVGRKLDFLMQEFNREANTLCSKSQNKALTGTGLEIKVLIDQMREQVQNVE